MLLIDIDDIKKNYEALRESEAHFRLLAESAPVIIWLKGTGAVSPSIKPSDNLSAPAAELEANMWSRYIIPIMMRLSTHTHARTSAFHFEANFRLRRHDGEYRWMNSLGVPRLSDTGDTVRCAIDITDMKNAEQALRQKKKNACI